MSQEPKSEVNSDTKSNSKQYDNEALTKSESATLRVSPKAKDQPSLPHSTTLPALTFAVSKSRST